MKVDTVYCIHSFNALTLHRTKVHTVYCIHSFYTVLLHRTKVLLLALECESANKIDFSTVSLHRTKVSGRPQIYKAKIDDFSDFYISIDKLYHYNKKVAEIVILRP